MITIDRAAAQELNELIEDAIEYWCREQAENGTPVAGESAWKIVSAYAMAKEAQFAGIIE